MVVIIISQVTLRIYQDNESIVESWQQLRVDPGGRARGSRAVGSGGIVQNY